MTVRWPEKVLIGFAIVSFAIGVALLIYLWFFYQETQQIAPFLVSPFVNA